MSEFEDKLNSILSSPEQMNKIADMAKSLMGGEKSSEKQTEADKPQNNKNSGGIFSTDNISDAESISKIGRIIREVRSEDDDKTALLKAMEPYLSDKRRIRVEKGIKIARLAKIAKLALGDIGGDEDV